MTALSPWESAAAMFDPPPPHATNMTLWAQDRLGEYFWSKQVEIANSLRDNRYTAVKSCHDAGKSYLASRAIAHWIDQHEPGEAFVVSTAPTAAQVSAILWREIGKAHRKAKLPGSIAASGYPTWKIGPELVGYGRKPADYNESAFQGIHAKYVLVVIDEACGVDRQIFDAADALATNENARVLAIGNPDDPTAHFATICKPDSGWNTIQIDGLQTPNFTLSAIRELTTKCYNCRVAGSQVSLLERLMVEEGIPFTEEAVPDELRPLLLSPLWVEERLHRWVGRVRATETVHKKASESSLFTAKVRGTFPDSSTDGLIPLGWVEAAVARWHAIKENHPDLSTVPGRRVYGVDVASTGEDESAFAVRQGDFLSHIIKHRKADTMETVGVVKGLLTTPRSLAVVDVIGIGTGVVDRLREQDQNVKPFNASRSGRKMKDSTRQFTFYNHRAAAWWNLRSLLDPSQPGGARIALPPSEMLAADLTSPTFKTDSGAVIKVEGKDEIRKRLGRSTDEGDAVVHAFWVDAAPDEFATNLTPDPLSWWDGAAEDALSWGVEGMSESWLRE